MTGYAVVDLETTGLHPSLHDRIVEIGIVQLSHTGEVENTWCTLGAGKECVRERVPDSAEAEVVDGSPSRNWSTA